MLLTGAEVLGEGLIVVAEAGLASAWVTGVLVTAVTVGMTA